MPATCIVDSRRFRSRYTGKERDAESGNDYFEARYYSDVTGRFMSPDWSATEEPVPYVKLDDPQTLNLYSYVGNNPLDRVDTDGHCAGVCLLGALEVAGTAAEEFTIAAVSAPLTLAVGAVSQIFAPHAYVDPGESSLIARNKQWNVLLSDNPKAAEAVAGANKAGGDAAETIREAEEAVGNATGKAKEKLEEHISDQKAGLSATAAAVKALGQAKGKKATDAAIGKLNEQTKLLKGHTKDIQQQLNALKKKT